MLIRLHRMFTQVGVQTEIDQDAGVNALEEKVNEVHPLLNKDDDDDDADDST